MKHMLRIFAACLLLSAHAGYAEQPQYSAQNPPPASLVFAGPLAIPEEGNNMSVSFRFVVAMHSLEPDRIQIVDATTQQILIDDTKPNITESKMKLRSNPSLVIKQWEGKTTKVQITDNTPSWLHEKTNTRALLETRLLKGEQVIFSLTQPATYSYAAKQAILEAVVYNKSLPQGAK